MRALVLSVAVLMSAVASAQTPGLSRPPPPGQPTRPVNTQPAPTAPIPANRPVPGYNPGSGNSGYSYEDWDTPQGFRRRGTLVRVEREQLIERMARIEALLAQAVNEGGGRKLRDTLSKLRGEMNSMRQDVNSAPDL